MKQPLIALRHVSKRYQSGQTYLTVLNGIDLVVYSGEFLAITGPSGSGKTTLSHIIGGLSRPTSGEVLFENRPLPFTNDRKLSQYRNSSVGFVFQNYHLIPNYTALENVHVPLVSRGVSLKKHTKARQLLASFGLEAQCNQQANKLSGGQKQRVAIARALVTEPTLLIADEPTGNLDSKNGESIIAMLENLVRTRNLTVVIVTHDNSIAARADRIVRLQDGNIKEVNHARA